MRINDADLLEPDGADIEIGDSPNQGGPIVPEYLVIHYTAGRSGASSARHFLDPEAKASAHIVLDRSGKIWQLVPFRRKAWHAGISAWAGRHGLNGFSIGIEIDNAGKLTKVGSQVPGLVWRLVRRRRGHSRKAQERADRDRLACVHGTAADKVAGTVEVAGVALSAEGRRGP